MNFTIGSDPEAFLMNNQGIFISAVGRIGGSKKEPLKISQDEGFCVQEDGVAVEFNVPPAKTADAFAANITRMVAYLEAKAESLNLKLSITPSARFYPEQLKSEQAMTFGCDPDFNAWTRSENDKPACEDVQLRTCGGHIHIGCLDLPTLMCIRAYDLFLGAPSILYDKDQRRRMLYGKAGAYREQPYGHEYRVLSNFWIANPKLIKWVHSRVAKSLEFVKAAHVMGIRNKDFLVDDADIIIETINKGDIRLLDQLDLKYGILQDLPEVTNAG